MNPALEKPPPEALAVPPPPAALDESAARAELEVLAKELEDRSSVKFVARGFASFCVSVVTGGVSYRLLVDSASLPKFLWAILAVSVAGAVFAVGEALRARRQVAIERARFARLVALREKLGLRS